MTLSEWILFLFELLGTISFALSGAMVAMRKRTDLFGVVTLGVVTATGGGIFRDVFMGHFPPAAFVNSTYVAVAALISLLTFFFVLRKRDYYLAHIERVDAINNIFDAFGLGAFTVTGVQIAVSAGHGDNLFFAVFLGVVTGAGGGLLRDMMVGEIPFILTKHIYAVASIIGGLVYCLLHHIGYDAAAAIVTILVVFSLRMFSSHYRWDLPKAL